MIEKRISQFLEKLGVHAKFEAMLQLKVLGTNRQWDVLRELQRQEAAWLN